MPQFLHKLIIINIYVLSFVFQAQVLKDAFSKAKKDINLRYMEKEEIDKAFSLLNNNQRKQAYGIAHRLLNKKLDTHSKANTNLLLAYYFNARELIDSSMYYSNQALKYSKFIKGDSLKTKLHTIVYNLYAINSNRKGLLEESKKWHIKGIRAAEKYNEINFYYTHTHGLANVYREKEDYKRALKLYEQCLIYKDDPEIIYGSYINMGTIYFKLKDYDSSNKYFEKGLKLSKENENYYAIAVIKLNLAENYYEQNYIDEALSLFNEVIELSEEKEYKSLAVKARLHIGKIFSDLKRY